MEQRGERGLSLEWIEPENVKDSKSQGALVTTLAAGAPCTKKEEKGQEGQELSLRLKSSGKLALKKDGNLDNYL